MEGDTSLLVPYEGPRFPRFYFAAIASCLASLSCGFVLGYSSTALVGLRTEGSQLILNTTSLQSWFASLMALGALAGGLAGGQLVGKLGRKGTLMFISIPFILGWLIIAYAQSVGVLFTGRALTGFCLGVVSIASPLYISETAPASQRGLLGSGFQLFLTIGILISYILGKYVFWTWLAIYSCLPVLAFLAVVGALHETPTWLALRNRNEDAVRAFVFFRQMPPENAPIIVRDNDGFCGQTLRSFKKRDVLLPSILCLMLFFFQEFSGSNAILLYTVDIFHAAGSAIDGHTATIIVGLIQVVATFLACIFTDRLGRRILLMISGGAMSISMALLAVHHHFSVVEGQSFVNKFGWLPLVSICTFISAYSMGFGPLPWLVTSEILPPQVRGISSGFAQSVNWGSCFIVTEQYQHFVDMFGESVTYSIFAVICALGVITVALFLPETKGKTLEEIQGIFKTRESAQV
ncbi:facilitated trehalose transporter Tret1-like [Brevipalpus obovatus]|uniref:facilitated trehalose transporter Tret1-like n=1 Tax=Brevipalpus obovatus TaxID=246614 RepID=UPI003D9FA67A